ncbi:MAG: adenylate kinase family protein [Bryobacteraceae bacterium]
MSAQKTSRPAPAIILFGSPGSGKGTQAELLRHYLKVPHISTGDMLRTHIDAGDDIGELTRGLLKSGKLVSDDLVNHLVEARIAEPDCDSGIILDGYPRTVNQAAVLLEMMQRGRFKPAVIHLMVDYEKIVARLTGRRQCPDCGTLYSVTTHPPQVTGVCDLDGATLVPRDDDREPVIRERLNQYDMQTRPVLNYFRQARAPVIEIDGAAASPQKIMRQICDSLVSLGLIEASIVARDSPASKASSTP